MKLLSVIIPLYNSAAWLPKCLDSVLNQDIAEEDLEIICINDGSPDDSEKIAKRFQSEHPVSIVVLSQENQGPSGARNNGMRHATGKYLCFVDPDDYVEPNVFGGLLKQMEEQRLDMLRFNYQIVDEEYRSVKKRDFELEFDYSPCVMSGAEFLANRLDIACNIWRYFYRTDIVVQNQIWCFTGDYFDDTPWLPLVLLKTERIGVCDAVVYDYQERGDSLVKTKDIKSVKRKNEGYLLLIHLLQEEIRSIQGEATRYSNMKVLPSIKLDDAIRDKIVLWYDGMIAHSGLSLLTSTAANDPKSIRSNLKKLRDLKAFPLSDKKVLSHNRRKIRLFNRFPVLMMRFIQLKNKNK